MARDPNVLILDVATSGFLPARDIILEVACMLVDPATLDVLDTYSSVIRHTQAALDAVKPPDFHGPLLEECLHNPNAASLTATEGFLIAGGWTQNATVLCNRNLRFDVDFLQKHMPTLAKDFKWLQPLELKALETIAVARGAAPFVNDAPRTFRAPDDAISAYAELCHWMTNK